MQAHLNAWAHVMSLWDCEAGHDLVIQYFASAELLLPLASLMSAPVQP